MTIWAIGTIDQIARCFVETTVPQDVLAQMVEGEIIAPVTSEQRQSGVRMLGDMLVEPLEPEA